MPSSFSARIAMALTVLAVAAGFVLFYTAFDSEGDSVTDKTIAEVLETHTPALMARPEVVGTGIGECEGRPCIKVFVVEKTAELQSQVGEEIEGFPVELVESGRIRALEPK